MDQLELPPEPVRNGGEVSPSPRPPSGNIDGGEAEDDLIGPTLPSQNAVDEECDYLSRLMEFKAQKAASASQPKREEWMTELPDKMKKAIGLSAKSSFSRTSAGPSSSGASAKNLWTATPGTSKASTSKQEPDFEAVHSAERDRVEQQKSDILSVGLAFYL